MTQVAGLPKVMIRILVVLALSGNPAELFNFKNVRKGQKKEEKTYERCFKVIFRHFEHYKYPKLVVF